MLCGGGYAFSPMGPSIYYVSTFLYFFWPTHPPSMPALIKYQTSAKIAILWTHPPSPFADIIYVWSLWWNLESSRSSFDAPFAFRLLQGQNSAAKAAWILPPRRQLLAATTYMHTEVFNNLKEILDRFLR